jgi:ABC-2 type transport system ATP-binding protein
VEILKRVNFSSAYTALPPNLKVWQNLDVFARLYRVPNHKKRIAELLDLFEISDIRDRATGQLSSGESTRVNLCKALLNNPDLLMLDEPTASLDPDIADKVRRIIRDVQREKGMAVLYTSHNMRDVEQVCDRLIFMHHGKILCAGTPADVVKRFSEESLENVFIRVARGGDMESTELEQTP